MHEPQLVLAGKDLANREKAPGIAEPGGGGISIGRDIDSCERRAETTVDLAGNRSARFQLVTHVVGRGRFLYTGKNCGQCRQ